MLSALPWEFSRCSLGNVVQANQQEVYRQAHALSVKSLHFWICWIRNISVTVGEWVSSDLNSTDSVSFPSSTATMYTICDDVVYSLQNQWVRENRMKVARAISPPPSPGRATQSQSRSPSPCSSSGDSHSPPLKRKRSLDIYNDNADDDDDDDDDDDHDSDWERRL